ncbi:MAG: helicase-exonuclease AddAB subunit AddA [Clostridia bacterium]|nr:helicase-exonuclease AddAB subunit AddA [Clostridia bacterium]
MPTRQWTTQQAQCIEARGGTVLVSAAAGSGKTAVLIERIVSLLTDPQAPIDIDQLLVVTFTKAAAAEMRARLNAALSERIAEAPHDRHLLRQQMLLPQASICTIDSFCTALLREQAQAIGISPRFRVGDETALSLMRSEIAFQVIQQAYQDRSPDFLQLCDLLSSDRDDSAISEQMLRLYDFIQAHPFPLKWLDRHQQYFEEERPLRDTPWGGLLLEKAAGTLDVAKSLLDRAVSCCQLDEKLETCYLPSLASSRDQVAAAINALSGTFDDAVTAVRCIGFGSFKQVNKPGDPALKEYVASLRDTAKKYCEYASKALCRDEEQSREDIAVSAAPLRALFDLVRAFDAAFSAEKAAQNILDFNDMEHRVLSLLATPTETGFARTEAAREIGARYAYILIDEYQDTNLTQDTLFSALSNDEHNLFFVGDIKQSIYSFRQAMPDIFRERRENGVPFDGMHFPATIALDKNFRSRSQVTDAVNFFFERIMQKSLGGIDYGQNEALVAAREFPEADDPAFQTELLLIEHGDAPGKSGPADEARVIGQKIRDMMAAGFRVTDGATMRAATYRDFCILLRGASTRAPVFVKELQRQGIPIESGGDKTFFESAEIRLAYSFLQAIDNPLQDIPLLAVMLSPLFGFLPDDISEIRMAFPKLPLFLAAVRYAKTQAVGAEKCRAFLDLLDHYRTLAAVLPVDRLLRRLYDDTALPTVMSARADGGRRLARLRQLYDYARGFEQDDFRGLSAFVRYLDRLQQQEIDLRTTGTGGGNVVRLMTVHASKGLEFPIVFAAGLGYNFSSDSKKGDLLLHAEIGPGLVRRDRQAMTQSNTVHHAAVAAAIEKSERAEELRILYVALTRAKDKLIMTGLAGNLPAAVMRLHGLSENGRLPTAAILHAGQMTDLVLAAALTHPDAGVLRQYLPSSVETPLAEAAVPLHVEICVPPPEEEEAAAEDTENAACAQPDLLARMQYQYPYAGMDRIPAKLTASATEHHDDFGPQAYADRTFTPTRPAFLNDSHLSAGQRGTAVHTFLLYATFGVDSASQADALCERGLLTAAERHSLPIRALDNFLSGPLAQRMAASPLLLREFPFAVMRSVGEIGLEKEGLPADARQDMLVVQGVIDALFEEDGQLVIVDYKTDRVRSPDELIYRYSPQLHIYADAAASVLQRPVKECVIYSLTLNQAIPIDE